MTVEEMDLIRVKAEVSIYTRLLQELSFHLKKIQKTQLFLENKIYGESK